MKCYCSVCGLATVTRIPKGGDGSLLFPRKHNVKGTEVQCPGSFEEAEERADKQKSKYIIQKRNHD